MINFVDVSQKVFFELLRAYHDGIGKTHAAQPSKEVSRELAKEAYFITLEYFRTMDELSVETLADWAKREATK